MKNKIPVTINRNGVHSTILMPAKFCLIRHCQSLMNYLSDQSNNYNNPELMYILVDNPHWDKDINLSELGIIQSKSLGRYWNDVIEGNFKYPNFLSSSYERCFLTAVALSTNFRTNADFKEKESGLLFARNLKQLESIVSNYKNASKDKWNFEGGHSESFGQLQNKLHKALLELDSDNTVIVTHSDVITTIKSLFESKPNQTFNDYISSLKEEDYPTNGEIIEYDFTNKTVQKTKMKPDKHGNCLYKSKPTNLTLV